MTTTSNFKNPSGPFLGSSELAVNIDPYDEELKGNTPTYDTNSYKHKLDERVQGFNTLPTQLTNDELGEATFDERSSSNA